MLVTLMMVGKTSDSYVSEGVDDFFSRLKHYVSVKQLLLPDIRERKNLTPQQLKAKEGEAILLQLPKACYLVLMDEHGKEFRSVEFASFLQKQMNSGCKEIVFLVGGAYGVSETIRKRADFILAFSRMTFTHQFIRLMLVEQLYRAMTILRNEPYHNE